MNAYYSESSIFESVRFLNEDGILTEGAKLKEFLEKIKKIKNSKPSVYDDDIKIKNFVDKNYNDIVKATEICNKEIDKITKTEIKTLVSTVLIMISGVALFAATSSFIGLGIYLFGVIASIISFIIQAIKYNRYRDFQDELITIKKSLENVLSRANNIPNNYRNKILDLIDKIEDSELKNPDKVTVIK